ncbi:MAG: hypothetical protein GTO49_11975, partial [Anaerolineae bacterium]|nr:hypothetical protein [Anaerolineae bacterium]
MNRATAVPSTLSSEDPNLLLAADRLRRISWIWGSVLGAMGLVALRVAGRQHPFTVAPWLLVAFLLLFGRQPAYLAVAAVQSSLSLILLVPGLQPVFGPEPLTTLLGSSGLETIGLALVRIGVMITAWNQFLFYRMLYGTGGASGLDAELPIVPEVIPNRTDQLALTASALGASGLVLAWGSMPVSDLLRAGQTLDIALGLATLAIGFGLGSAFSPTRRRGYALLGV